MHLDERIAFATHEPCEDARAPTTRNQSAGVSQQPRRFLKEATPLSLDPRWLATSPWFSDQAQRGGVKHGSTLVPANSSYAPAIVARGSSRHVIRVGRLQHGTQDQSLDTRVMRDLKRTGFST